jgi:hypothetical protein
VDKYYSYRLKKALEGCGLLPENIYEIFGELSEKIHGSPWSGPSIKILKGNMSENAYCFVKNLAEMTSFKELITDM